MEFESLCVSRDSDGVQRGLGCGLAVSSRTVCDGDYVTQGEKDQKIVREENKWTEEKQAVGRRS